MISVLKASSVTSGPYSSEVVEAAEEFNANVPATGIEWGTKKSLVTGVLPLLVAQLDNVSRSEAAPSLAIVTLLQAVYRVISSHAGYKIVLTLVDTLPSLYRCLGHEDTGIQFWALRVITRLLRNPRRPQGTDTDLEVITKRSILVDSTANTLINLMDYHCTAGSKGTLVVMAIITILDLALVSGLDTTDAKQGEHLMRLVASRYLPLLSLFRSPCAAIIEGVAMLLRRIVYEADVETARAMQDAALSEGILLHHFYNAIFGASPDQRYVSRYLVELWSLGFKKTRELYRHMLPTGMLVYLEHPSLSEPEKRNLEEFEASLAVSDRDSAADRGGLEAATKKKGSSLASRLRRRLEAAEEASKNKEIRRLVAIDEETLQKIEAENKKRWGSTLRLPVSKARKREEERKAAEREAEHSKKAAAMVAATSKAQTAKLVTGRPDNFSIFFHMLMRDHNLPDLMWNTQTREELRSALEAELREIEKEVELGGTATTGINANITNKVEKADGGEKKEEAGEGEAETKETDQDGKGDEGMSAGAELFSGKRKVAWNHAEFEVEYPSLSQEIKIGNQYLRLFLDSGENAVADLRDPRHFFDALYKRVLRETAPNLRSLCLRGMAKVYGKHWEKIGEFEDTDYLVWLMGATPNWEVRDRCLILLQSLAQHDLNAERMITASTMELLVDLMTTAHTQDPEQRELPTVRMKAGLLLRDGPEDGSAPRASAQGGSANENKDGEEGSGAVDLSRKPGMQIWHYRASSKHLKEGEKDLKGPYSLEEMRRIGQMKHITKTTLVWAQGMRDWVMLQDLRPVLWYILSEGSPTISPLQRGEVCASLLLRLVRLRPSTDAHGHPVRPVPKAKR